MSKATIDKLLGQVAELKQIIEAQAGLIEVVSNERDALAAQVKQLRAYTEFWMNTAEDCAVAGTKTKACEIFEEAILNKTPAQCLAERDAEVSAKAVEGYAALLRNESKMFELQAECNSKGKSWYNWQNYYAKNAEQYANQLRQAKGGEL